MVAPYDRAPRAVTVPRLAELADFYRVPVSELLPEPEGASPLGTAGKIVLKASAPGFKPATLTMSASPRSAGK